MAQNLFIERILPGTTLRALWNTGRVDLRIGLNEVSLASRAAIDAAR